MTTKLYVAVNAVDDRLIALALAIALCFAAFEGWQWVLRKPYAEYQALKASADALVKTRDAATSPQPDIDRLETELAQATQQLDDALRPAASETETAAFLMTELDRIATRRGIALIGVKPNGRRVVADLDELAFEVAAEGAYLSLCQWLLDLKSAITPSVVATDFEMRSAGASGKVVLTVKVVLYGRRARAGENR